jgi:UDP-N-acetylglucosamine 2-epimerase
MKKIITIVGARPQFVKAATVSRAISEHNSKNTNNASRISEIIIHTGQHYDDKMSNIFFEELKIPAPSLNLAIGSGFHGQQTGQMLSKIEDVLLSEQPDLVLVYGDTNSTLAGALAAAKLHIPIAHVEAGLRSFNKNMPEEINRVLTDHCANQLFCPTNTAVTNLANEGITEAVHLVGDVMYDSLLHYTTVAEKKSNILERLNLKKKGFALATVHRAGNTDDIDVLRSIFSTLNTIANNLMPVIIPLHPRTKKIISTLKLSLNKLQIINPVSYFEMLQLEKNAHVILTDSGGIQKEAYWLGVPCVTLRNETEWAETVEEGANILTASNSKRIIEAVKTASPGTWNKYLFGYGDAAEKIVEIICSRYS